MPQKKIVHDKDKIVAVLQAGIRACVGYSDSRLSKERTETTKWLDGDLPAPVSRGGSTFVSRDVWEIHSAMSSQLLETFTGNFRPLRFLPAGAEDTAQAQIATDWCSHVIHTLNDSYGVFGASIDDGLSWRVGIAKVWYEPETCDETIEVTEWTADEAAAYLAEHRDAEVTSIEEDVEGGIARYTITVKRDTSRIRIAAVPPEEFGISQRSKSIAEAPLVFHRYRKTYGELRKEGYDKKKLDRLREDKDLWSATDTEVVQRHGDTDDTLDDRTMDFGGDTQKTLMVYECYAKMDPEKKGVDYLHQVILAGDEILSIERTSRAPFIAFVPLPKRHAFMGYSFDQLSIDIQKVRTALVRSVVDHTLITTNPRWQVVRGALMNPRELTENRIGGLINVSRPDGIVPLPQPNLNPFVYQTIELMNTDKESRTGVSRLATGLSKDAVSKQNSAEMVDHLVSLSQIRQKVVARNFAHQFLRDLYEEVYRLTVENVRREQIIDVAGEWVPVDPTGWPEKRELHVSFTLGYGEQEKEAAKLVEIDQYLVASGMPNNYTPPRRYAVLRAALEAKGIRNITEMIGTPDDAAKPVPPNPETEAKVAVLMADAKAKEAAAQVAIANAETAKLALTLKHEESMARIAMETKNHEVQAQLARDKLNHGINVDTFEMVATTQADQVTAVVNPSGS